MNTYNDYPNLSLVLPGGCNANCAFCYNKGVEQEKCLTSYTDNLREVLSKLPKEFTRISITGGEPCLSPSLLGVLNTISQFINKYIHVVLNTNGTNLVSCMRDDPLATIFLNTIDHVNVSRHHNDDCCNEKIFTGDLYDCTESTIPDLMEISYCINNKHGIDFVANCVIGTMNDMLNDSYDIEEYIDEMKSAGFRAVVFRKVAGDLLPTKQEKLFDDYKVINSEFCPVCSNKTQLIQGMPVIWKKSLPEPVEIIKDKIYELVFNTDGKLYSDWNYQHEICNFM